jgi:hypothetical protein
VVRYSSFVDLIRVAYANVLSAIIAIISSLVFEHWEVKALTAFNQTEIAVTFGLATRSEGRFLDPLCSEMQLAFAA